MNRGGTGIAVLLAGVVTSALLAPIAAEQASLQRSAGALVAATSAPSQSPCDGALSGTLSLPVIRVCEETTVTLRALAQCHECPNGVTVVIVVSPFDGVIDNWQREQAKQVLAELRAFRDAKGLEVRVGVVDYDRRGADIAVDLTTDLDRVENNLSLGRTFTNGGDFSAAAGAAIILLNRGRSTGSDSDGRCEVVLFASGYDQIGPPPPGGWDRTDAALRESAKRLQREASVVVMVCTAPTRGTACDIQKEVAGSLRLYTGYPESRLASIVASYLREWTGDRLPQALVVDQRLPSGLAWVTGAARPTPSRHDVVGGLTELSWSYPVLQPGEVPTVTYRVRPAAEEPRFEGEWPITGTLVLTDSQAASRTVPMRPLTVTVAGLCVTPTPTASETPAPTITRETTPEPTPSQTATEPATASPTATRSPQALFLPVVLKEECVVQQRRVDAALVIDASTSMLDESDGVRKLDAARDAALAFIGVLRLDAGDQATVVVFNSVAQMLQPLADDRQAIDRALAGIETAPGTRIHLGIDKAHEELVGPRHREGNVATMIVLTDGQANPEPVSLAIERAGSAKAEGVIIFTVGLGDDLDVEALKRIASKPEYAYQAPSARDLKAIYEEIAEEIPCPAEQFWGKR